MSLCPNWDEPKAGELLLFLTYGTSSPMLCALGPICSALCQLLWMNMGSAAAEAHHPVKERGLLAEIAFWLSSCPVVPLVFADGKLFQVE